jgi:hypothetical protein
LYYKNRICQAIFCSTENKMGVYYSLVLIGLVVEIIACFILSIEAIGLDRVTRWTQALSLLRSDLTDEQKERPFFSRGSQIPRIFTGLTTGLSVVINYYYIRRSEAYLNWWQQYLALLIGSLVLGLVAASIYEGSLYGLKATINALRAIESRSRARTSGILGFLLLLLGFILQFSGTLGQALSK